MTAPDFLVHDNTDNVGVIVVEGVMAGQDLTGLMMASQSQISVKALADIPLGHKIALSDLETGDTVSKYDHDIGKVVAPIKKGDHAHVHNVKTKRW